MIVQIVTAMACAGMIVMNGCGGDAKVSAQPAPVRLAGGWSDANADDDGVKGAAEAAVRALAALEGKTLRLEIILSARQQVVAGVNYQLTLRVAGRGVTSESVDAVIWKKIDGTYELTKSSWIK